MATLAATPNGHQLPLREQSHLDLHAGTDPTDPANLDERLCPGCKLSAVNEQGGLVVAFGYAPPFLPDSRPLTFLSQPILLPC